MPSSKNFMEYIVDQLSSLEDISCRAMMGEYLLYYRGKLAGGIYDDRLLVKPVEAAVRMKPDAPLESPYEEAKAMLFIEDTDDQESLATLFRAMYDQLPAPQKKRMPKNA